MRFLASEAASAIGARLVGDDASVDGASFDTRTIRPGQLFVPIVAERDGHDFLDAAYAAGASCHLAGRPGTGGDGRVALEVDDTADALLRLARWGRRRSAATVVGVTGSVGKTSTKDLIAAACSEARPTTANERSFNNEQGMPVTILCAPDDTEVLVLEMGMRGFGQISALCDVASPDVGVVTAVGYSHTELVGGIEGVARAKRELVEALPADGTAVLNADDPRVVAMASSTAARVLTYGAAGEVRIEDLRLDPSALAAFTVRTPWGSAPVRLGVPGAHMASNAAAAIAVAGSVGVDVDVAADALSRAVISGMRMERVELASGGVVVNDAYNANPTSTTAALETLAAMAAGRRVAVLGAMAELDDVDGGHRMVAERARELGVEVLAFGTDRYGMASTDEVDDVVAKLGELVDGDVVLVKASRSAGLERVVEALVAAHGRG